MSERLSECTGICLLFPDPFLAFLCPVLCHRELHFPVSFTIGFWVGSTNQSYWKKVERGRRETARIFILFSVSSQVSEASMSPLWVLLSSPFPHGPAPSGRSTVVPALVWWPQLLGSWNTTSSSSPRKVAASCHC